MIDVFLSDFDCTLADTRLRAHLAPTDGGGERGESWIPYSKGCASDLPLWGPITVFNNLSRIMPGFIVSGRNVEALEESGEWLKRYSVNYSRLRLRRLDDLHHNGAYKVAYIKALREEGFNPVLMLEDHVAVSEMIERETGVPTLTVNPRFTDTIGVHFNMLTEPPKEPWATTSTTPSEASPTSRGAGKHSALG